MNSLKVKRSGSLKETDKSKGLPQKNGRPISIVLTKFKVSLKPLQRLAESKAEPLVALCRARNPLHENRSCRG